MRDEGACRQQFRCSIPRLGGSARRKNHVPDPTIRFTLRRIVRAKACAMQYKRISADCHLDLPWLPAELFVSEAKRELQGRMPYVEDRPDGPHSATNAGVNMGLVGGVGSVGVKCVPGQNYRLDKMARTGLYETGRQ